MDIEALRREHYNASVSDVRRVHDDLIVMRVRPDAGIPSYEPGQWIRVGLGMWEPLAAGCAPEETPHADRAALVRRPYSLSSPILTPDGARLLRPGEEEDYELFLALARDAAPRGPVFAARLFALVPGSRLWVAAHPEGRYTLEPVRPSDDVLFVATGTGEAPHNRMIWELLRRGHDGRIASVLTTRRRADQAYRDAHERLAQMFPNYCHVAVATREPDQPAARLQEMLQSGELESRTGVHLDPRRCRVYLCGNPAMIGAPRTHEGGLIYPETPGMVQLLESQRGFSAHHHDGDINIHYERYW